MRALQWKAVWPVLRRAAHVVAGPCEAEMRRIAAEAGMSDAVPIRGHWVAGTPCGGAIGDSQACVERRGVVGRGLILQPGGAFGAHRRFGLAGWCFGGHPKGLISSIHRGRNSDMLITVWVWQVSGVSSGRLVVSGDAQVSVACPSSWSGGLGGHVASVFASRFGLVSAWWRDPWGPWSRRLALVLPVTVTVSLLGVPAYAAPLVKRRRPRPARRRCRMRPPR